MYNAIDGDIDTFYGPDFGYESWLQIDLRTVDPRGIAVIEVFERLVSSQKIDVSPQTGTDLYFLFDLFSVTLKKPARILAFHLFQPF